MSEKLLPALRQALFRADYNPPLLPASAMQLLEMSRRPDVSFREVVELLERDPMIAGRVLSVAQSPLYGRGQPVRTLEQALTRLGLTTLSHIFMQVVVTTKIFRVPQYAEPMELLRRHAVVVAHGARLICRSTALDAELAFLCGLLHDVGFALGLIEIASWSPQRPVPFDALQMPLADVHADVTSIVARSWNLPAEVALVLKHHHSPVVEGRTHPLAAAVQIADAWADELGFGAPGDNSFEGKTSAQALGLGDQELQRMRASLQLITAKLEP